MVRCKDTLKKHHSRLFKIGHKSNRRYSRFQNIAAGKFVAAESDIESENYNEEDWANLNIWVTVA